MIESIKEFWYLYLLLAVTAVITVFVWKKAISAASKHSKEFNANLAKAKRAKELRDAYSNLTEQIVAAAPADTLFEGISLCLEAKCQKSENTAGFYETMTDGEKSAYALYYLLTDAEEGKLSSFFKASGKPLTSDALNAAKKIFGGKLAAVIEAMSERYDEDNEEVSVIPQEIEKLDEEFASLTEGQNLFAQVGDYIKANPNEFIK